MGRPLEELPRSTRWLQAVLEKCLPVTPPKEARLLDVGSAEAHIATLWTEKGRPTTYCHYELSTCQEVATSCGTNLEPTLDGETAIDGCWLQAESESGMKIAFTDLVPVGPYKLATFDTRTYEAPYAMEMVEHIAAELDHEGWLLSVIDGRIGRSAWSDNLRIWFDDVQTMESPFPKTEGLHFFLSRGPQQGKKPSIKYYTWQTTFQNRVYEFWGAPGVFSPRGLDPGTALMLEVMQVSPEETLLDLGCGTGVVAVIANRAFQVPVVAIDNSARALRLTRMNCHHNLVDQVQIQPSDGLGAIETTLGFDVIACNPPYHTDFAVARRFIEGSRLRLREGGRVYFVVKRTDWYERKLRSVFGGCRKHTNQDGYTVLISQRKQPNPKEHVEIGTRKHQKRLERTRQRKRISKRF